MIQIIKNWYKVKKIQSALKAEFYGTMEAVIREKDDIKKLALDAYNALKDTPKEELQDALIAQIAAMVHEENRKNQDTAN